jgi:hypothetical protein
VIGGTASARIFLLGGLERSDGAHDNRLGRRHEPRS